MNASDLRKRVYRTWAVIWILGIFLGGALTLQGVGTVEREREQAHHFASYSSVADGSQVGSGGGG